MTDFTSIKADHNKSLAGIKYLSEHTQLEAAQSASSDAALGESKAHMTTHSASSDRGVNPLMKNPVPL